MRHRTIERVDYPIIDQLECRAVVIGIARMRREPV